MIDKESPSVEVRVYVLGDVYVERRTPEGSWEGVSSDSEEWGPGTYARALLRYLLCHGRRVGRGTILDTLWPEIDSAERYLNNAASTLRRVFHSHEPGGLLETVYSRTAYQLAGQGRLWMDYEHCEALLQEAGRVGQTTEQGLALLQEAEGYLRRGPFLADELGDWCLGQRENVRTAYYHCRLWLAEAYEVQRELWQAEKLVEGLLREDPTDESALCRLMHILHTQGLTTEALRRCKHVAAMLGQQGLTLSAETERLAKELQSKPRVMAQAAPVLAVPSSPDMSELKVSGDRDTQEGSTPSPLCDLPLSAPTSAQPMHILLSSMYVKGAGAADSSIDWASWFGLKQYDIIHLIYGWYGSRDRYDEEVQMLVDREIKMIDEMLWQYQQQDDQLGARRQFLFALVALPLTLHTRWHDLRADTEVEAFLRLCSASLSACWHLMRGNGLAIVSEVVAQYVPTLMSLARGLSPSQPLAARLTIQAKILQAILSMHRLDFAGRELCCLEAVQYSRLSGSSKMQAATLMYLGYTYTYYFPRQPEKASTIFLEALRLLGTETSLFRSDIYVGLADAYAQCGQEKQALESIELAKQHFPKHPEQDPSFLYAGYSRSELYQREGKTYLDLARHSPDRDFYQGAYAAFTKSASLQSIGVRSTSETLIHLADAACGLGELELYVDCLHRGAQMAIALGSQKRYSEAFELFQRTPENWKAEQRILVLAKDVFR